MKEEYAKLYKQLIEAYYNNNFEATLSKMLKQEFASKEEAREILTVLCGVDLREDRNNYTFTQNLVHAIVNNQIREKIVQKVKVCSEDCETTDGKSKCQTVCPFDAITKDPISYDKWIDPNLCMSCGRCVTACDKGNYMDTPQFMPLGELLLHHESVVAIVAPAIAGQYGKEVSLDQLREAFVLLGFTDMVEVAMAADALSLKETFEYNHHVHHHGDVLISSCCCPVWVALLKKAYYELIPDISPSVSPMIAMGRIIKALNPDVKVVFVGPCVAKKAEAKEPDIADAVDYVLTFDEIQTLFEVFEINPSSLKGIPSIDYAATGGRLYARAGGVSEAVSDIVDQMFPNKRELFTSAKADGVKECRLLLDSLQKGEIQPSFIEGMGCVGGCVGGPKRLVDREEGRIAVNEVAYDSAIKIPVNSEILLDLLRKIGIHDLEEITETSSIFERSFK